MGARLVIRVQPPVPLGDVTMVPAALLERPAANLAHAMAEAVTEFEIQSAADVLSHLRQAFPLTPLKARVAALQLLMKRGCVPTRRLAYSPR
jgi:hypothetical protein